MEIIILGCGTSTGVPIVGCDCPVCRSDDPRDRRLRSSAAVRLPDGGTILIDTSPDLRTQGLVNDLRRVDHVLYTHCHADHTHGIDELRTYNYLMRRAIDIHGAAEHMDHLRRQFAYIFEDAVQKGGGKPQVIRHTVEPGRPVELLGLPVTPLRLCHGKLLSVGWRIGDFAYLSDVSRIPEESRERLRGLEALVIGALRYTHHSTHFTVDEAVREIERLAPRKAYITHMGHDIHYRTLKDRLPAGIEPAYDGLRLSSGRPENQPDSQEDSP